MERIRIGVIGTGALGSIHARVATQMGPGVSLAGVFDTDAARAAQVAAKHGAPAFDSLAAALEGSDALVIATPTKVHAEVARKAIEHGRPCLIEKPLARTVEEGRELVAFARERGVPLMVGHVERFNPVVQELLRRDLRPRYLEAQRVSPFAFRSTDIGVVFDLMIHDIDLVLHLVPAPVEEVHAVGFGVLGEKEDLANARLLFADGSIAQVTASRLALKTERKLRLFAPDLYASLDLRARKGRIIRPNARLEERLKKGDLQRGRLTPRAAMLRKLLDKEELRVKEGEEPIMREDREFVAALREGRDPAVPGEHGLRAMETAERVVAAIEQARTRVQGT